MEIRDAQARDVPGITLIYNDAVEHTTAIWNEELVDDANRSAWLADRQEAGFPVLVAADSDGAVLGVRVAQRVGNVGPEVVSCCPRAECRELGE